MKRLDHNSQRICLIGNTDQNYLVEYINLSRNDITKSLAFKNLNLTELKCFSPDIIVIDQYFVDGNYNSLINSIKMNFKDAKIYFLSPEYANYNGVIQSMNNKNHLYSNFSVDILNHINDFLKDMHGGSSYLNAG